MVLWASRQINSSMVPPFLANPPSDHYEAVCLCWKDRHINIFGRLSRPAFSSAMYISPANCINQEYAKTNKNNMTQIINSTALYTQSQTASLLS